MAIKFHIILRIRVLRNRMKKVIFIVFSMIVSLLSFGQSTALLDSLQDAISKTNDPKQRIALMLDIAKYTMQQDIYEGKNLLVQIDSLLQIYPDQEQSYQVYLGLYNVFQNIESEKEEHYEEHLIALIDKGEEILTDGQALFEIARYRLELGEISHADSLLKRASIIANKHDDLKLRSNILNTEASIYGQQGQFELADAKYKESVLILEELDDVKGLVVTLVNHGILYDRNAKTEDAHRLYYQGLELAESNQLMVYVPYIKSSIANGLFYQGDVQKAIQLLNESIEAYKFMKDFYSIGNTYERIGQMFGKLEDYDKALQCADSSVYYITKSGRTENLGYVKGLKANVYNMQGKWNQSIEIYTKLLKDPIMQNDKAMIQGIDQNMAQAYSNHGQYPKAISSLDKAIEIAKGNENLYDVLDLYKSISDIYYRNGNTKQAYLYAQDYIQLNDSLTQVNTRESIQEIETKYQTEKKQAENEKLIAEQELKEQTISTQRKFILAAVAGLGALGFLSFFLIRMNRQKNRINKELEHQKRQIQTLNREMHHRVKNNLAFMTSLLEMQERRIQDPSAKAALKDSEARIRTLALAHQQLLKNEEDAEIAIKPYLTETIAHLKNYFDIPDKSLNISSHIDDFSINSEDAMRLGLIINELITNSIKHAFQEVSNPNIIIKLYRQGQKTILDYKDNGPGVQFSTSSAPHNNNSLGTKLIELLKKQLGDGYVIA